MIGCRAVRAENNHKVSIKYLNILVTTQLLDPIKLTHR